MPFASQTPTHIGNTRTKYQSSEDQDSQNQASIRSHMHVQPLCLWELCSKFLSLFCSEFLLKSLHYAEFIPSMLLIL